MSGERISRNAANDDYKFADDPSWNGTEKAWCPVHRREWSLGIGYASCPWCDTGKEAAA